jgi:threonine dehydratase
MTGHPANIGRRDIDLAYDRIKRYIRRTPIVELGEHPAFPSGQILLKLESVQHAGSFKTRGAFNNMLGTEVPPSGVIAASGGNHGAAVAYVARRLVDRAEIYVPEISSPVKVERIRQYGAKLTIGGADYGAAYEASLARANETGARIIHAFDQAPTIAGQGTIAREFEEQAEALDSVVVAVGGGGLIAGVLAWFEKRTRIVGVEPRFAPTMTRALEAGHPIDVEVSGIAADALGARRVGDLIFSIARSNLPQMILVQDSEIAAAQRFLWSELRVAAEPAGAAALAALLAGHYNQNPASVSASSSLEAISTWPPSRNWLRMMRRSGPTKSRLRDGQAPNL